AMRGWLEPAPPSPEPAPAVADEPEIALPPNTLVHVDVRRRFKVRLVHVVIAASSDVRWQPNHHVLVLERGSLEIGADRYDAPATIDLELKHAARAESTTDLLARARAQVVPRDYRGAEATVRTLLARTLSRTDEAEGRIVLANVAQATGHLDDAATLYLAVASKFADLPAGESALYAAARIDPAVLPRYLDRYPNGRYADDVRRQLEGARR